jgi:hypothetical protein
VTGVRTTDAFPSPVPAARRRRISAIRRTVAATAGAVFLALFATIYAHVARQDAATASPAGTAATQTDPADGGSAWDDGGASSGSGLAPLTTAQS